MTAAEAQAFIVEQNIKNWVEDLVDEAPPLPEDVIAIIGGRS